MKLHEEHMQACCAEFRPKTEHERFLVQTMAHSRWKLDRLQEMEVKLFDVVLADVATPAQTKLLASLQKYTAAAERSYYKAFREFHAGRKAEVDAKTQALMAEIHAIGNAPMPSLHGKPATTPKTVSAPHRR